VFSDTKKTEQKWLAVAKLYQALWNFPHAVGATDGKHVVLQCPRNRASEYFNNKNSFSIVLFALVDANYNFTFVDAGCQGRISDSGVFTNTELYKKLETKNLCLPQPVPLNGREKKVFHNFFIGDEAFPLSENLMKVHPRQHPKDSKERTSNYRICRARRVVENVFGLASSLFRVLRKLVVLEPEKKTQLVAMTIACLHNFLRRIPDWAAIYTPPGTFDYEENGRVIEGSWRAISNENMTFLFPIRKIAPKPLLKAKEMREELAAYFLSGGRVERQNDSGLKGARF